MVLPRYSKHLLFAAMLGWLGYFLFWFTKDTREELFLNPVHFFDDAYMFLRYAKIWHLGGGEAWNLGEHPVYGNTSQLHFLVVLALTAIPGIADDSVIKWASFIPSFLLMLYLPGFALRHSMLFAARTTFTRYLLWSAILLPLWYWNTPFGYHAYTGMDTALSVLVNLAFIDALLCYARSPALRRFTLAIVLLILAWEVRPENLLACTLFAVLYLGCYQQQWRDLLRAAIIVTVLLLGDLLLKYFYFGDVVPLAFYSKHAGFYRGYAGAGFSHPLLFLFIFLLAVLPFVVALLCIVRREHLRLVLACFLPVLAVLLYFCSMQTMMGFQARYFYPFAVYILVPVVLLSTNARWAAVSGKRWLAVGVMSLLAFVGLTLADQYRGDLVKLAMPGQTLCDDQLKDPGKLDGQDWYHVDRDGFKHVIALLQAAPVGVTAAMTEHGYVGSQIPKVHILDMTGLHNRDIAHRGFSASAILGQQPDVIWLPHWHYTCMNHDLLHEPGFQSGYDFYPGLFTWGLALRRNSPYYPELSHQLESQVQQLFPAHHLADFRRSF